MFRVPLATIPRMVFSYSEPRSYSSVLFLIMKNSKKNRHRKEPMPRHLVRSPRSFRASDYQYDCIRQKAAECGMTVSDYVLCRAMDYEPRARLTIEQERSLAVLADYKSSVTRLFSTLNGKSQSERMAIVRSAPFMVKWTQALNDDRVKIMGTINEIKRPNKLPPAGPRTSKSSKS